MSKKSVKYINDLINNMAKASRDALKASHLHSLGPLKHEMKTKIVASNQTKKRSPCFCKFNKQECC